MKFSGGGIGNSMIKLSIGDVNALYDAYMPFVLGGGLFVPTGKSYTLGDEVFLLLDLFDEPEVIPLAGRVVWVTPKDVVTNRKPGIGIQLNPEHADLVGKIETLLAGLLTSDRISNTL
ncbi:MAG: pilus assembly protein PilZ [Porticoccaceae bacterium]|nr:pilus assembly protein PilZ [Porticoccaceae bacterium]